MVSRLKTDDELAELCARGDLGAVLLAIDAPADPQPTWTEVALPLVDLIGRLKARLDTPLRHYRVAGDPGPGTTRIVVDTGEHIEIRQPDGRALAIVSLSR